MAGELDRAHYGGKKREGYMNNSTLRRVPAAVIILVAVIGKPLVATADSHESDGAQVLVTATTSSNPMLDPGACDPTTFFLLNPLTFKEGEPACVLLDRRGPRFSAISESQGDSHRPDQGKRK